MAKPTSAEILGEFGLKQGGNAENTYSQKVREGITSDDILAEMGLAKGGTTLEKVLQNQAQQEQQNAYQRALRMAKTNAILGDTTDLATQTYGKPYEQLTNAEKENLKYMGRSMQYEQGKGTLPGMAEYNEKVAQKLYGDHMYWLDESQKDTVRNVSYTNGMNSDMWTPVESNTSKQKTARAEYDAIMSGDAKALSESVYKKSYDKLTDAEKTQLSAYIAAEQTKYKDKAMPVEVMTKEELEAEISRPWWKRTNEMSGNWLQGWTPEAQERNKAVQDQYKALGGYAIARTADNATFGYAAQMMGYTGTFMNWLGSKFGDPFKQNFLEKAGTKITNAANQINQYTAQDTEALKLEHTKAEAAYMDIASNIIQMAYDGGIGAAIKGGKALKALGGLEGFAGKIARSVSNHASLIPMYFRSAGGGALEAQADGANLGQSLLYGNLSGLVETFTELMFDGVAGIYGKAASKPLAESLEKMLNNVVRTPLGRIMIRSLADAVGEGTEEIVSSLLNPIIKRLSYDEHAFQRVKENPEFLSELIYDFLIGAAVSGICGGGGTTVQIASNRLTVEDVNGMKTKLTPFDAIKLTDAQQYVESLDYFEKFGDKIKSAEGKELAIADARAEAAWNIYLMSPFVSNVNQAANIYISTLEQTNGATAEAAKKTADNAQKPKKTEQDNQKTVQATTETTQNAAENVQNDKQNETPAQSFSNYSKDEVRKFVEKNANAEFGYIGPYTYQVTPNVDGKNLITVKNASTLETIVSETESEDLSKYDIITDAIYGKGNNNVEAERNNVSDGGQQRETDQREVQRDESVRQVSESSGTGETENPAASVRQNQSVDREDERIRCSDLINKGVENHTVAVVPENAYDDELKKAADKILHDTGITPTFVLGEIKVMENGTEKVVCGVYEKSGKKILIRADHPHYTVEQIAAHETFHAMVDEDPGLLRDCIRVLVDKVPKSKLTKLVDKYVGPNAYLELIENTEDLDTSLDNLSVTAKRSFEDLIAFAYSKMDKFSETASNFGVYNVIAPTIDGRLGKDRQSEGTQETRGPTEVITEEEDQRASLPAPEEIIEQTKTPATEELARAALPEIEVVNTVNNDSDIQTDTSDTDNDTEKIRKALLEKKNYTDGNYRFSIYQNKKGKYGGTIVEKNADTRNELVRVNKKNTAEEAVDELLNEYAKLTTAEPSALSLPVEEPEPLAEPQSEENVSEENNDIVENAAAVETNVDTTSNTENQTQVLNEESETEKITEPSFNEGEYIRTSDDARIFKVTKAYNLDGTPWIEAVDSDGNDVSLPASNATSFDGEMSDINAFLDTINNKSQKTLAYKHFTTGSNYADIKRYADNPEIRSQVYSYEKKIGSKTKTVNEYRLYGVDPEDNSAFTEIKKLEYDLFNFLRGDTEEDLQPVTLSALEPETEEQTKEPQNSLAETPAEDNNEDKELKPVQLSTLDEGENENGRTYNRRNGERTPRLPEELQVSDVQEPGEVRGTVAVSGTGRNEDGRRGNRTDASRPGRGSGEGNSQNRDLRRSDGLTLEGEREKLVSTLKKIQSLSKPVQKEIEQKSKSTPKGSNFVIGESLNLPNGAKARFKSNVEAIKLVKQLQAENRYATAEEQEVLSKYVGWGGIAEAFDANKTEWSKEFEELKELLTTEEYEAARGSTLNAHYTSIDVIRGMYEGLKQLGYDGGRMLEPSSGTGNFVGAMPTDMSTKVKSWTMVELDSITGQIAKYLYPQADVRIQGFEKALIPNNYIDVAIGNVPFGNYSIVDKAYPKQVKDAIHNYFFAKTLDKVRPGGIVMFITSHYTMDSRDDSVRKYMMSKADFLGAIRLPNNAFKSNAGTSVVSDIIILQKRADKTTYNGKNFTDIQYYYPENNYYSGSHINQYFAEHPEMMLGKMTTTRGMYSSNEMTLEADDTKGTLKEQIINAFSNIEGHITYPEHPTPEQATMSASEAGKKARENGLIPKNGKIYQQKDGQLKELDLSAKDVKRVTSMLNIKEVAGNLLDAQRLGKETETAKLREQLNNAYDSFVSEFGYLNTPANKKILSDDPYKFALLALEDYDPDTRKATKTDIFEKNTVAPNVTETSAENVSEGLIISMNRKGTVDTAFIASLTGKTEADVKTELIASKLAFKNREGELEPAEVYLSGNVRAKLRDAEALVASDPDYEKNIEALKDVIPADVAYTDIYVTPGASWIPGEVYNAFVGHILETSPSMFDVSRTEATGNFTVEYKSRYDWIKKGSNNTQEWGTSRRTFLELFEAMLNSRSVTVMSKDSSGRSYVDKDATNEANDKVEKIQKEFQDWLWSDETRRNELSTLYNEVFNSIATPTYNGDNLTVNGANSSKPLRPHQRDAVQRIVSSGGNTLLAHKVGAGKTYEMAAAAMKLKELGIVQKPMFIVPKSLVAQWGKEFKDFFPAANLLVAEATDFQTSNRKVFINRIANNNYDAIILSYEQFEKIPMSDEYTAEMYRQQVNEILAAIEEEKLKNKGKSLTVKDLEKRRKQLEAKIEKLTSKEKDVDNINFENLGVDSLFVDEAHNFKNLMYTTSMNNVAGLGNKNGSGRAFDLYTKTRYLQQLNGGRGIVFATATPVMNSMAEMYIMQRYLQPDLLNELGLNTFDAWAKQFGEVVNAMEINPSGSGYRVKQSFSHFKNMSELQLLFKNFADVLTDIPGLKIPKMKNGRVTTVVCEPGEYQLEFMKQLEERANNVKNVDPSVDNMLKITSDGRKISYTQRMIDPTLPYEEGCKIYRAADNIVRVYEETEAIKGTQVVFLDMATPKGKSNKATESEQTDDSETIDDQSAQLYDDLKARLVKNGIPAKEIAFIHDADTDAKKKKLFADVNAGTVRVLIGSTGKMGVGMNAQKRIAAIHHLDAPWRPGDVEQRNGRAYRQGNINEEVECFTYVTEGSFDARLWNILERKQGFINQVMNGDNVGREVEDTGEITLSAAEIKALASGNPLIEEQVKLENELKRLESLDKSHYAAIAKAKAMVRQLEVAEGMQTVRVEKGSQDVETAKKYNPDKFSMKIDGVIYSDKKEAGKAFIMAAYDQAKDDEFTTIGTFAGFELRVINSREGVKGLLYGAQGYNFNTYKDNPTYGITALEKMVTEMYKTQRREEAELGRIREDIEKQRKLANKPFDKADELREKRNRYSEVMAILNPPQEQAISEGESDDGTRYADDYYENSVDSQKPEEYTENNPLLTKAIEMYRAGKRGSEIFSETGYALANRGLVDPNTFETVWSENSGRENSELYSVYDKSKEQSSSETQMGSINGRGTGKYDYANIQWQNGPTYEELSGDQRRRITKAVTAAIQKTKKSDFRNNVSLYQKTFKNNTELSKAIYNELVTYGSFETTFDWITDNFQLLKNLSEIVFDDTNMYADDEYETKFNELTEKVVNRTITPEEHTELDELREAMRKKASERIRKDYMDQLANEEPPAEEPIGTAGLDLGGMTIDEYAAKASAEAEAARKESIRTLTKEEFNGSEHLDALGVKVAGSVGLYEMLDSIIANDKSAKSVRNATRAAERRLKPTPAEKAFARGIAQGLYQEKNIPPEMDDRTVSELAQYYEAEIKTGSDILGEQRRTIIARLHEKMYDLFGSTDTKKAPISWQLRFRTPDRNMRHLFGDTEGEKIYREIFYPVQRNEAEKFRFINRMYEEVREIAGQDGKKKELTKQESALAMQVVEGRAAAEKVAASEMSEAIKNAVANWQNGGEFAEEAKAFGLGVKEKDLAKQYARWLEIEASLEDPSVDKVRVNNAADKYSEMFNKFYDAINDFLVAHGYEPIGFIKGYVPHLQPDETQTMLDRAFNVLGLNTDVTNLPTEIAGLTSGYKPNKRWNPYFMHRTGHEGKQDIVSAYESYVRYLGDIIYHTDDIMRIREMSKFFRQFYSRDSVGDLINQGIQLQTAKTSVIKTFLESHNISNNVNSLSDEEVHAELDKYVEEQFGKLAKSTTHGDLVTYLDNYANLLAGKQSDSDRSPETTWGRKFLNIGTWLTRSFAMSQVGLKISSALNQTAQLPIIYAELGSKYTLYAMKDIMFNGIRKSAWAEESDFLTGKKGINYIVTDVKEMLITKMFAPAEIVDSTLSTIAVRGAFLKAINEGKSYAEAMEAADKFGNEVMGSRMKGTKPENFEAKSLSMRMLTMFQIEALNTWEHVSQDLPRDFRIIEAQNGRAAATKALAGVIVKAILAAFTLNRLTDELYGGTPAPFDILGLTASFIASGQKLPTNKYLLQLIDNGIESITGDRYFTSKAPTMSDGKFDYASALSDAAYNLSSEVPLLRNGFSLFGIGDNTLPLAGINTAVKEFGSAYDNTVNGEGSISEYGRALMDTALEFMPGGSQMKRTAQGIEMLLKGGSYTPKGKLKYAVDADPASLLQVALFGQYSTDEAQDYYAAGYSGFTDTQQRMYDVMIDHGLKNTEVYNAIRDVYNLKSAYMNSKKSSDESDSFTKDDAKKLLNGTTYSNTMKAIIWQCFNASWKAEDNPFNRTVGNTVYNAMHDKKTGKVDNSADLSGLSLPKL